MKIKNAQADKYGYRLVEIYSQTFFSASITQKSYKGLAAKYKKNDKSIIPIYFSDMKPSIINKKILKEKLSNQNMISILAENINNIYIMEDSELSSITEEETMELLSLLPSATTEDKNHIKHIKNYMQKAKNNYINLTK